MAFFEFVTGGVLLAPVNVTNLILQNSYIVIMALGMLLIIVGGNIDLSVGSIVGFVGAIAATHDGGLQDALGAGGRHLAAAGRRDRRGAGLFRRLRARSRRSSSRSAAC